MFKNADKVIYMNIKGDVYKGYVVKVMPDKVRLFCPESGEYVEFLLPIQYRQPGRA